MQSINQYLPTTQDQEQPLVLSDILTDEEKWQAVDWAILQRQKEMTRKMKELGYLQDQIEDKICSINWSDEIDTKEVLLKANERKYWKLNDDEERKRRKREEEEAKQKLAEIWKAEVFYKLIKQHFIQKHNKFSLDNKHYITALCLFLSNDKRFENNYSFGKGLMIIGTAGLGKTETIKAISQNPVNPVRIYSMIDISEQVKENGSCNISITGKTLLDDVGTEPEVINHYGTKITWFKDFIENYYLKGDCFNNLIITTNCGGDELEKRYGYRVRSRLREMFNIIQLTGNDLRQ